MDKTYNFKCDDGYTYVCKEGSCLICKNCASILWDYTNGPYMINCALDKFEERDGKCCKYFKLDDSLNNKEDII